MDGRIIPYYLLFIVKKGRENMAKYDFVNRHREFSYFEKNITPRENTSTSRAILLYSESGIGKARFVEEYIARHYPFSLSFEVKIAASPSMVSPPYHFFNTFYAKMENTLLAVKKIKIIPSIEFSWKFFTFNISIEKNSDIPKDIEKKIKTVRRFLNEYPQDIILSFENFQVIDLESLLILQSLMKEYDNLLFFFEYSLDENHGSSHLLNIFEYIRDYSVFAKPVRLEKMDQTTVFQIIEQASENPISQNKFRDYYIRYQGNIDELMIYLIYNNLDNEIEPKMIFETGQLSNQAIFVSYILLFCRGHLFSDELLKLISLAPEGIWNRRNLKKICEELYKYNIVTMEDEEIILNNSAIQILEHSQLSATAYTAFGIVEADSSRKLSDNNHSSTESLYRLIYSYYIFKDERILELLPYIKERLIYSDSFYKVIKKIDEINHSIPDSSRLKEQLTLGIVDILYSLGHMSEALSKLKIIFCEDNLQHLMYMLALKGVLKEEDFLDFYTDTRKRYKNIPEVKLFCDYIYLYYLMKYSPSQVAKNYAKKILDNKKYQPYLVYYFVQKNYSTYLNNDEAICLLEKSENEFRKQGRNDLAIRTKITLAMRNANLGQLEKAEKILHEAENENKYDCMQCYFLNNFAMINILKGNFCDEVENNLREALFLMPTHYEKGIILCNLLIYYCETNNLFNAQNIAKQLEDVTFYQYSFEQYNHILHYNLYFYYSVIQDNGNAGKHYMALKRLYENAPDELREYMDATIFGENKLPVTHRRYYYSKYKYRPDYIGYWQLEVPDFSSVYEERSE